MRSLWTRFWRVSLLSIGLPLCSESQGNVVAALTKPFAVSISAVKGTVVSGSPVYITVSMVNTTDHDVDCSAYYINGSDRRFQVTVLSKENGLSMARHDAHPEMLPGSFQMCTLAPGESTVKKEMLITAFHDLTKPGSYLVSVRRAISNQEKDGAIMSNQILIVVVP